MAGEINAVVIGGGPAGLAAAWRLVRSGARVTLLDRASRAGGLLRTEIMDGAKVDVGVQLVGSTHSALQRLANEVDARDLLRRSPGHDALWRRGRAHGITYGSLTSMATSGALPTTLKLRLAGRYLPYLRSQAARLDANDPSANGGAELDTESIGAWGARELGTEFVELLVYPLLAAYYGATPDRTSAPVYHGLARVGLDVSVIAAVNGFGALADAIMGALDTRGARFERRAEVSAVEATSSGVRVVRATGEEEVYDVAVVATPPNRSADMVARAHPELGGWLRQFAVQPTFSLALRMDRPFPGDYFGLTFPRGEAPGDTVAALCIQSRKLKGLVADGDAIVALPAPAAAASLMARSDDEIAATMLASLEAAVRGITKRVLAARVHRHADGCVLFEPGHLRRLTTFDTALVPQRLALAGSYLVAPTVEGAIRSGERAAARLAP